MGTETNQDSMVFMVISFDKWTMNPSLVGFGRNISPAPRARLMLVFLLGVVVPNRFTSTMFAQDWMKHRPHGEYLHTGCILTGVL